MAGVSDPFPLLRQIDLVSNGVVGIGQRLRFRCISQLVVLYHIAGFIQINVVCQLIAVVLELAGLVPHGKDVHFVLCRTVDRQNRHIGILSGNCPQCFAHKRLTGHIFRMGNFRFPKILQLRQRGRKVDQFEQVVFLKLVEFFFRLGIIRCDNNGIIAFRAVKGQPAGNSRVAGAGCKGVRHFYRTPDSVHGIRFQLEIRLLHRRTALRISCFCAF